MATIYLSLSSKSDTNPQREIRIRFKHGKIDQQAKTNIFIPSEYWDDKTQEIIIPNYRLMTDEKKKLKQYLTDQSEKLNALIANIQTTFNVVDKSTIAPDWLKQTIDIFNYPEKYTSKEDVSIKSFFECYEDFVVSRTIASSTIEKRRILAAALQRFEQFSKTTLDVNTITPATLKKIEDYLRSENKYDENQPNRSTNTLAVMFKIFRSFVKWCNDNEITNNNPFRNYNVPKEKYGTPFYITIEERNQLYNTDLTAYPALAMQRDIFVFQCMIGCRVSDLYKFTKQNLVGEEIVYIAQKTREEDPDPIRVPLNAIAKEILAKYDKLESGAILPFISVQKYNDSIKEIFTLAELTRPISIPDSLTRELIIRPLNEIASSHLARRTFVGNLYKKVKDPNLVCKLSGHKEGSKAFARYREIDEDMKKELVKMLE